jgi:hypothetical protein
MKWWLRLVGAIGFLTFLDWLCGRWDHRRPTQPRPESADETGGKASGEGWVQ